MATNYPGALDAFTNPNGTTDTLDTPAVLHHEQHANANDAIEAIEAELGVNPSGASSTVAARLAALDSTIAGLPGGDANVFDAVAYGAVVDGVTDDTAAWQAALNAVGAAGAGVVMSSKAGVTVIAGPLQDTGGANAQLLLPDVHMLDAKQIGIEIRGPWPQSKCSSVVGAAVTPTTGLIFKSTLASGTGAVLGGYGSGTSYQNFTFVNLTLRNLTVRTVANPTISAVDLRHVNQCTLDGVVIETGQYDTSLTEPTTATSFGLRLPTINNGAHIVVDGTAIFGFYNALEFSEHAHIIDASVGATKVAMTATAANHSSRIERILVGYAATGLKFTGTHYLDVGQMAIEHASSGWMATTKDVDDPSNYGHGTITWAAVLQGVGPHNSFVKTGGSNLNTYRVGEAPAGGGGGGTTTYVYRDEGKVAPTAADTLTLGAVPVLNSPLVWVAGVRKRQGTDYAIAADVITFTPALTGGELVDVYYTSTSASAGASTVTRAGAVDIQFTFDGTDSASNPGLALDGVHALTPPDGSVWGRTGGLLYRSSAGAATKMTLTDAGTANCTVSVKMSYVFTGDYMGLVLRADGAGNDFLVQYDAGSTVTLIRRTAGVNTSIGSAPGVSLASTDVLSVVMLGSSFTVKKNGSTIITATDTAWTSNTKFGVWAYEGNARFDALSIQS